MEAEWLDLKVPGETVHAFRHDWGVFVFTGMLVSGFDGSRGKTGVFVDTRGREKRIQVTHERIADDKLVRALRVGDLVSMAYFSGDSGHDGPYFYLYDHARRDAYVFADVALQDLYYVRGTQGSWVVDQWRTWRLISGFERSPQFERIRQYVAQRVASEDQVSKQDRVSSFLQAMMDSLFSPRDGSVGDREIRTRVYKLWLQVVDGSEPDRLHAFRQTLEAGRTAADQACNTAIQELGYAFGQRHDWDWGDWGLGSECWRGAQ